MALFDPTPCASFRSESVSVSVCLCLCLCVWLCLCFFFTHKYEKEQSAQSSQGNSRRATRQRHDHAVKGALPKSPITSETEGASPSAPELPWRPNSEHANALATAHRTGGSPNGAARTGGREFAEASGWSESSLQPRVGATSASPPRNDRPFPRQ